MLQMRILRLRDVRQLAQGHTARRQAVDARGLRLTHSSLLPPLNEGLGPETTSGVLCSSTTVPF